MIVIAPWFLLLFGKSYSFQGTTLLRLLSAAAPFAVQVGFYFSYLRFQKRILRLIGLSAVVAVTTICLGTVLISSLGIAAFGIGWFVGFLIVATVALNELIADKKSLTIFKNQSRLLFSTLFR
jgi:O-antigen/teichoic acid export membrane protein